MSAHAPQPPTLRDTHPNNLSWAAALVITAIVMLAVTVSWFFFGIGSTGAPAGITQIHLPRGGCPRPVAGQTLIVTVYPGESPTDPLRAGCRLVAGRSA